jgi:lysophospholipase L1-like esterase
VRTLSIAPPGLAAGRELRIVAVGTSLTSERNWRFWRACGGHWVRLLRGELQASYGPGAAVENLGHWGADSAWALRRLPQMSRRRRADHAFVEFAINDADERRGISLANSRHNLLAIVQQLRACWPGCGLCMVVTNPVFGRHAADRPRLGEYYDVVREVANEAGTGLLDTAPAWQATLRTRDWRQLLPDGIHPGAEAARLVTLPEVRRALGL